MALRQENTRHHRSLRLRKHDGYNQDGVPNRVAYFMGENGLTTNPGVVNGKVTWPHVGAVIHVRCEASTRGHALVVMLAYILVRELARRSIDLDLTVSEGLDKLATLCVTGILRQTSCDSLRFAYTFVGRATRRFRRYSSIFAAVRTLSHRDTPVPGVSLAAPSG